MNTTPATPLFIRFWEAVDVRGEDECWPWTGTLLHGRPVLRQAGGRCVMGRRLGWDLQHDVPVQSHERVKQRPECPTGLLCMNPAHQRLESKAESMRVIHRRHAAPPTPEQQSLLLAVQEVLARQPCAAGCRAGRHAAGCRYVAGLRAVRTAVTRQLYPNRRYQRKTDPSAVQGEIPFPREQSAT